MLIISGATPENETGRISVTEIVADRGGDEIVFCLECRVVGGGHTGSAIISGGSVFPEGPLPALDSENGVPSREFALSDAMASISVIVPTAVPRRAPALTMNLSELEH